MIAGVPACDVMDELFGPELGMRESDRVGVESEPEHEFLGWKTAVFIRLANHPGSSREIVAVVGVTAAAALSQGNSLRVSLFPLLPGSESERGRL